MSTTDSNRTLSSSDILKQLTATLEARKSASPDDSYVASLHAKGLNKILEKVGEESIETLLAARDAEVSGNNEKLIYETADLWFHSLLCCRISALMVRQYSTNWLGASICLVSMKRQREKASLQRKTYDPQGYRGV